MNIIKFILLQISVVLEMLGIAYIYEKLNDKKSNDEHE